MNNKVKVSVIIPVYNSEAYIEKCINSVLKQTYDNYEIIVINDGSKDASGEIIENIKKEHPDKIKYINQENIGVAKTRNNGINIASGEYIAFIDNDDYIESDYLETLVNNSKDGQCDIVVCGYRRPNENGKIIKELYVNEEKWSWLLITAPWAKIYKTSYLRDNNLKFLDNNIGEDVYLNLQAYLLTDNVASVNNYAGYNWFFNTASVSNSSQKDFSKINVFYLLNSCIDELKKKNILDSNYKTIELFFFRYIIWFLLFSCKGHKYNEIKDIHKKLFTWLKEQFPNYKKDKIVGINRPKGEGKKYQLFYLSYMITHKIKIDRLLIFLYSKI